MDCWYAIPIHSLFWCKLDVKKTTSDISFTSETHLLEKWLCYHWCRWTMPVNYRKQCRLNINRIIWNNVSTIQINPLSFKQNSFEIGRGNIAFYHLAWMQWNWSHFSGHIALTDYCKWSASNVATIIQVKEERYVLWRSSPVSQATHQYVIQYIS